MSELLSRTWWTYDPAETGYSPLYHGFNLLEGAAWCIVAGLILLRCFRRQRSGLEILYAASFLTFAASDFREAYVLDTPLILAKGGNLIAIALLRQAVLRRFYPESRTF